MNFVSMFYVARTKSFRHHYTINLPIIHFEINQPFDVIALVRDQRPHRLLLPCALFNCHVTETYYCCHRNQTSSSLRACDASCVHIFESFSSLVSLTYFQPYECCPSATRRRKRPTLVLRRARRIVGPCHLFSLRR